MQQPSGRLRWVGDVRRYNLLPDKCYGMHGIQLGLAYLLGAHSRVQPVLPFQVHDEMPVLHATKPEEQSSVVRYVIDQLPEGTDMRLLLGATVITSCIIDAEETPRRENENRFRYLGGFLVRAPGAEPINVHVPGLDAFDNSGSGMLSTVETGANMLHHAIVMPHPRYAAVRKAIRLSDAFSPVYGGIHDTLPEVVVDRHEVGLDVA